MHLDARIDHRIEHIDHEVDDDDHRRQQHHAVADHDQVAIGDRLEDQPAKPRQIEHVLDHDRSSQQVGELQAHHRHDGDHRVAQHMPPQHIALAQPLGARGAYEILAQHLEHGRTRDPCEDRGLHHGQRNRRQQQGSDPGPEAIVPAGESSGGKPLQLHRKQQDQQDREPEIRQRNSDLGQRHDADVCELVMIGSRVNARRKRQHHGDQHGHDGERDGQHQSLRDQSRHGRAIGIAVAEIADHHSPDPVHVAGEQRLVQPELDSESLHRVGRCIGAHQRLGRIAGQRIQYQEDDQRGSDKRRQQGQKSSQDEYTHALSDSPGGTIRHVRRRKQAPRCIALFMAVKPASARAGHSTPRTAPRHAAGPRQRGSGRPGAGRSAGRRDQSRTAC